MQNDNDGDGTHWVLAYQEPHRTIYMDSFGVIPPKAIFDHFKKPIMFNKKQIQDIDSEYCGWFCLFFLDHLKRNKNMVDKIMDNFKKEDLKLNDEVLKNYFKR